jgi:hypothetical protein
LVRFIVVVVVVVVVVGGVITGKKCCNYTDRHHLETKLRSIFKLEQHSFIAVQMALFTVFYLFSLSGNVVVCYFRFTNIHIVMLLATSLIEEEHQTWYFFTITLIMMRLLQLTCINENIGLFCKHFFFKKKTTTLNINTKLARL